VVTNCNIHTDASAVVITDTCPAGVFTGIDLAVVLDAGNLQGHALDSLGNPVSGAVIFATATDSNGNPILDSTGNQVRVKTTTDKNGRYGLQLDQTYTWTVALFYANLPGAPQLSVPTPSVVSWSTIPTTLEFVLGVI
jgi:hypothetical protein